MTATAAQRRAAAAAAGAAAASDAGAAGADAGGAPAATPGRGPRRRPRPSRPPPPPPDPSALNIAVRPESYNAELAAKVAAVRAAFAAAAIPLPAHVDVHASSPAHFRQRAEFGVWHAGPRSFYAMFARGSPAPIEVSAFPFGSERINELMPALLALVLAADDTLRRGLFQARFLTTRAGEALVTLIYRRALDDAWKADAEAVRLRLGLVGLVGRSRGQRVVLGREHVIERLPVGGAVLEYKQVEDTFSQSNAGIAAQMLTWAQAAARAPDDDASGAAARAAAAAGAPLPPPPPREDDLLELYCGSGAFTVALAPCFRNVLATELSKAAVAAAEHNLAANGVRNVALGRVSAEELKDAMDGGRPYERLRHVDMAALSLRTVLVDPPRAGCGADVMGFLARFPRIVYISCNPETMAQDVARLQDSHEVARFALFDQFPYTPHAECGALLVARAGAAGEAEAKAE